MSEPVRVLIVEDNPTDHELAQREIRKAVGSCVFRWVETRQDFLNALAEFQPDLVLSDYNLPSFDGLQALKLLRERAPLTPLILWTGSLSEDIAVESMRAGANNYVIKENLKRLGPAVIHALEERRLQIERKQAETALRQSEERYRSLFENTPISIWEEDFSQVKQELEALTQSGITDLRAHFTAHPEELSTYIAMVRITDVNKAALRMYEAKNRDEMLKNAQNLFHQMPKSFLEELLAIAEGRLTFQWEGEDQTLTGKKMIVDLNWIVTPGYEADYSKIVVSTIDVTETRLAEERLRALNAELEQRVANRTLELTRANRAKDEFLATMSHELRTPLNSILGLSETLLEELRGPLNEYQRNSLQIIESSGRHLLELINDVLDLSKIEAGKFDYYPQVVDVDALCRSSLAFVKEQALRKSITLEYQALAVASQIYADPRRLKQILVNLLTNAVKFTAEGGKVTLQIQSNVEVDLMRFSVIDTGIGIAPDDLPQLFQPFVQVDSALNRQFEGTGLGLALVQRLTDMHGGSVEVASTVGQGSRFTINLPWRQKIIAQQELIEAGGNAPPLKSDPVQTGRLPEQLVILLAEDNETNVLTVGEYLKSHGYQVVVAHDGAEAIEKAEALIPHLILMDIQMPVMDGLEAIRRLRTDSRFDSTPIIALTALAMPGDRELCFEAGANEYLSKPVSLKNLVALIAKLLSHPIN